MIELALTSDAEAYGRKKKHGFDRRHVEDAFQSKGTDKRWTGHAAEYELHRWLDEQGLEHEWRYDSLGSEPDFNICGIEVALKANSGDAPREDFIFTVNEPHVHKLGDGVLFAIVQIRERRLWLAGYLDASKFRQSAERRQKGSQGFLEGRPIEYDCRTIRADALVPASTWFGCLERCVA